MAVLGLNLGKTRHGKGLKDGGACIIEDGRIEVAIAEERVSRVKYAGGFKNALAYCLEATQYSLDSFSNIVVSSCCEDVYPRGIEDIPAIYHSKLHFIPSHHLSHAYSAFCVSPFDKAIIIVMDGGGNVIGTQKHLEWWKDPREQNSYYIGDGTSIELIDRDFDQPYEVGFGEAYRYFSYYLGWPSAVFAGKTMALAAYGDPDRFKGQELFTFKDGKLQCKLTNNPFQPIAVLKRYAQDAGVKFGDPRKQQTPLEQHHMDLAFFVQDQLEEALIKKIRHLCQKTGITNLCVAGGVGLNCVANTRILEETPVTNLFIQPAAGDQGQALGNALYGYHFLLGNSRSIVMTNAYHGRVYDEADYKIGFDLLSPGEYKIIRSDTIAQDVAQLIANGSIVGWFQGKSELGPRALGNRSILADPRTISSRRHLDAQIKHHEWFRPYAPSVMQEFAAEYFDTTMASPFMLLVASVTSDKKSITPAIVHEDSSARLQTVSQDDNPRYYELIESFRNITGIPLLLNTSFNSNGEPIVETPEDAIRCFREYPGIKALAIGDYLITRLQSFDASINTTSERACEYNFREMSVDQLHALISSDFPEQNLLPRSKFELNPEHIKLLQKGIKSTIVRYRPDAIDIPASFILPLIEFPLIDEGLSESDFDEYRIGTVKTTNLIVKPFVLLNKYDALRNGFSSEEELKIALQSLYTPTCGRIRDDALVSIYTISLIETTD